MLERSIKLFVLGETPPSGDIVTDGGREKEGSVARSFRCCIPHFIVV
jgi:hypothetical protein